jgi:solute carrier family 25 (mitochondrial S-adenosylmethionine transporter), member 26
VAETAACLIRVPTEVVKQRMQVGLHNSAIEAVPSIIKRDGILGLYNGFGSTRSFTHTYI